MGSCKDSKQMELDKILKETKFDHTNKALMTYYSSGLTPKIKEFFVGILKANIPLEDVKALTLILYNQSRNGATITGHKEFYRGLSIGLRPRMWEKEIRENQEFVCGTYHKTRKSTLKWWKEAIALIDKAKKRTK